MRGLLPALEQALFSSEDCVITNLWQINRIQAKADNVVFQCRSKNLSQDDLAAKIMPHNSDRGAWREYAASRALWYHNIKHISAEPVFLIEHNPDAHHDLVITEWIEGQAFPIQSFNKLLWTTVLNTLAEVHQVTPDTSNVLIPAALNRVIHPQDLLSRLLDTANHLELDNSIPALKPYLPLLGRLLDELENNLPRLWHQTAPQTLTHGDWNIDNFIYHEGTVRFVDWELSGWSDPAIDLATLLSHPNCLQLTDDEQRWLINQYATILNQPTLNQRIKIYWDLLDARWFLHFVERLSKVHPQINNGRQNDLQIADVYAHRITRRYGWS